MTKKSELALDTLASEIDRLEREVERRDKAIERLKEELRRDHKTGLFNLRELERFVRDSRYPGWYVFADGDGLGLLNKTEGHDVVDGYIAEFSEWLRQQTRYLRGEATLWKGEERRRNPATTDAIATRFGGDEFVVWCSNKRGALRIRNAVRKWRSLDGRVTWSAGMGKERSIADSNCSAFKAKRKTGRAA